MLSLVSCFHVPSGPFLEGPEKFSHPESRSKMATLMITKARSRYFRLFQN